VVVVEESGSFGFPFFIFVKFFRVGIFALPPPALDYGIVLLLSGFTNYLEFLRVFFQNFFIQILILKEQLWKETVLMLYPTSYKLNVLPPPYRRGYNEVLLLYDIKMA
jgi:hypothetical protein